MKTTTRTLFCLCLFCIIICGINKSFAQKFQPKYLRENDKSLLALTSRVTDDGWLEFRADAESVEAASFSVRFAKALGIAEGYKLRLVRDKTDVKETRHPHYQLYWKDALVEEGHLDLHSRKGRLIAAHSRIVENLDIVTDKPIAERQALDAALADRKLTLDGLDDSQKLPKGVLVLTRVDGDYVKESYRLAYSFDLYSRNMQEAYRVYVDAVSGQVLKRHSLISNCFESHHADHAERVAAPSVHKQPAESFRSIAPMQAATFNSLHPRSNPTPSFEVEPFGGGYRLTMSTNVAQALRTRRDLNNNGVLDDPDLTNPTTSWGNNEQHATLAHWVGWRSYQYFLNRFGMNGTDGQGTIAQIFIAPTFTQGANWTYGTRTMKIGQVGGNILSTVDIVGHEYGHGVSYHLVGGWTVGTGETGALNEGFSDIIGTAMERELYPTGSPGYIWNWQLGENALYVRDMEHPHNVVDNLGFGQPQIYQEPGYWDFNNLSTHHNNGVLNKWFHTLNTGNGPNGNIAPIGFDDAMSVVYWGLENYIYGDYNYPNAANALRIAAGAVFGECSPQQVAVRDAWAAVGIQMGTCSPDCNYQPVNIAPTSANCNQGITLSANCAGINGNSNYWTCQNVTYSFAGPNVPFNSGSNSSISITAPSSSGNYQYSLTMSKPSSGCYVRTTNFNINVNCSSPSNCDFSSGPRYVGTWNGLTVQIRSISGKNVLVTAITGSSTDKYYPRGDNFWGNFSLDPNAAGLQSCLNAGSTGWGGLALPGGLTPPSGYYQGTESDGAVFFAQNGSNPTNPCDFSTPRQVGTWNGLNVQIRQFPNSKRALVTHVPGSSNDKYYPRGDNFWDNFTKDSGAEQYRPCLNAGDTGWWGLAFPGGITPPGGYQQGTSSDGAVFFSTNGLRKAAGEPAPEEVTLVTVRPNPAQDEVTVTVLLNEAGTIQVRLLDLQGRTHQQQMFRGTAGKNERVLKVSSLATGVYAMKVSFEGQRVIHKLVKE